MTTKGRGTAVYRSPEVYDEHGGYNNKADIWALGCIAYEMFTKEKAFSGDWDTMRYRYTCLESPKRVIGLDVWEKLEGRATELSKKLAKRLVDDTLQLEWETRPSAMELLEFLRDSLSHLGKRQRSNEVHHV
jgi:serine/threonine protein kinase